MTTDTERRQAQLDADRATIARVKENYAHYPTHLLRIVHRDTQIRAQSLRQRLASGKAAKDFRYSGDLIESLRQVEWKAHEQELVAEGVKQLLDEREDS